MMVTSCTSKVSIYLGKCTGTEQNTVMKDSLKNGWTSIIHIKQNWQLNSAQPLCSCSGRELRKEQKMHASLIISEAAPEKSV